MMTPGEVMNAAMDGRCHVEVGYDPLTRACAVALRLSPLVSAPMRTLSLPPGGPRELLRYTVQSLERSL